MTFRNTVWQGKWAWILAAIALMLVGFMVAIGLDDDESIASRAGGIALLAAVLILVAVMHNWITVEPGQVRLGFIPFYRTTLKYADIGSVSKVTIQPFRHYGGLGIRGWARSKRGLLLGGAPPQGLKFETRDGRRYIVTFRDLDPIVNALAIHGCTLSAEKSD